MPRSLAGFRKVRAIGLVGPPPYGAHSCLLSTFDSSLHLIGYTSHKAHSDALEDPLSTIQLSIDLAAPGMRSSEDAAGWV